MVKFSEPVSPAEHKRDAFEEMRELVASGNVAEAFVILRTKATPEADFVEQSRLARLLHRLDRKTLNLTPLRIAFLSTSTVAHFSEVLWLWLALDGFDTTFYIAEFDTIEQTVINPSSDLYDFKPDIVWLFTGYRDVQISVAPGMSAADVNEAVQSAVCHRVRLWETLQSRTSATILQNNADLPEEQIFGNFEGSASWGRTSVLRRFNVALADAVVAGVTIFDLDQVAATFGRRQWFDLRYWFHSKHAFAFDAYGLVAHRASRLIASVKGRARKCIVLDLDNTLWGGVIGDDGIEGIRLGGDAEGEAYVAFQEYLKSLKTRGILLAVCSKNEEAAAREPFLKHSEMRLSLDDLVVFQANWNNKADNIVNIARILNIGVDSLVFVDDNPVERDFVRRSLPDITVVELPTDPAGYVASLDKERLFETISFSAEDQIRSQMYQENTRREEFSQQFSDLSAYLQSLEMVAIVGDLDAVHLKRMQQLISKSNQFHLTGVRLSEADLLQLAKRLDTDIKYFKLSDRFGDNGLIAVLVLQERDKALHIDAWVMSCRVLSRGMEDFIIDELCRVALRRGCQSIIGQYIPTRKNALVASLYERLGFEAIASESDGSITWRFNDLEGRLARVNHYITRQENDKDEGATVCQEA
jgi:FkbH-like protein